MGCVSSSSADDVSRRVGDKSHLQRHNQTQPTSHTTTNEFDLFSHSQTHPAFVPITQVDTNECRFEGTVERSRSSVAVSSCKGQLVNNLQKKLFILNFPLDKQPWTLSIAFPHNDRSPSNQSNHNNHNNHNNEHHNEHNEHNNNNNHNNEHQQQQPHSHVEPTQFTVRLVGEDQKVFIGSQSAVVEELGSLRIVEELSIQLHSAVDGSTISLSGSLCWKLSEDTPVPVFVEDHELVEVSISTSLQGPEISQVYTAPGQTSVYLSKPVIV